MTTERLRSRDLPHILEDLATGPYPDYVEDVLATTAQMRQRPAWTFPERWFPMVGIAREPAFAPRLPWRSISMAIVLLALLIAAAVVVGTRPRLPEPFGRAGNGLVAIETAGDIYTVDPVTGVATAIVAGPEADTGPRFSLDGAWIAFERKVRSRGQLYVVRPDGTDLKLLTPEPLSLAPGVSGRAWEKYEFAPDGKSVLIATMTNGATSISIARTDGSDVRQLDVGMPASEPSFRPPSGTEILFIGGGTTRGVFAVDPATAAVREIVVMEPGFDLAGASWSPDGSQIVYWSWSTAPTTEGFTAKSHVVNADGTGDRELPLPPGAVWNAHATWSNDGTQLFIAQGFSPGQGDVRGFVVPADGSSVGTEVAPAGNVETACCAAWMWSPDDSKLVGRTAPTNGQPVRQVVIDVATREARPAPWTSASDPTWQRVAP